MPEEVQSVASGLVSAEHAVLNIDGDIFLKVKPANPADVNGDGTVNILDLTLVAQALGTADLKGDVNGDGVINVFDLVFVAGGNAVTRKSLPINRVDSKSCSVSTPLIYFARFNPYSVA